MELLQRDTRVIRFQGMPLLKHTLCELELLGRHRNVDALLQPRDVGLRVREHRQLVGKHLCSLLVTTGREQTVERQLRVLTLLARLLGVAGPATLIPLVCFNAAARHLPYTTLGFMQYIAPVLRTGS